VYRRCSRCGVRIAARHCTRCGSERSSWTFVVDIGAETGRRVQRSRGGFATKRAAVAAMYALQRSVAEGTYVAPSALTVGEYLEQWLDGARLRLRPGAYDACEVHVRVYIAPRIGQVPLQRLTTGTIKALYAELRKSGRARGGGPLSAKTVHNVHRTLSRALNDAVTDRLLAGNPAARAHRQPESPEMPTWSAEELHAFLEHVAGDPYAALWRLAATTGMRRGELVALRWRDVDFDAARVTVVQQLAKGGGTVTAGPTKTRRSRRLISLDPGTVEALRQHRKQQLEGRLAIGGAYEDHGLVFCRPDGHALHPDRLTQMFRQHCKAAGLPYVRLQGLRHTHATLMLRAGAPQGRPGTARAQLDRDHPRHLQPRRRGHGRRGGDDRRRSDL
jgi:integrase